MKLREQFALYNDKPQDVDLYHWDYDEESTTMVDLSMKDFTEAGLTEFDKALNADVVRVSAMGENWVSIYVTGVSRNDIKELSLSHAGYCSDESHKQWFTMDTE